MSLVITPLVQQSDSMSILQVVFFCSWFKCRCHFISFRFLEYFLSIVSHSSLAHDKTRKEKKTFQCNQWKSSNFLLFVLRLVFLVDEHESNGQVGEQLVVRAAMNQVRWYHHWQHRHQQDDVGQHDRNVRSAERVYGDQGEAKPDRGAARRGPAVERLVQQGSTHLQRTDRNNLDRPDGVVVVQTQVQFPLAWIRCKYSKLNQMCTSVESMELYFYRKEELRRSTASAS